MLTPNRFSSLYTVGTISLIGSRLGSSVVIEKSADAVRCDCMANVNQKSQKDATHSFLTVIGDSCQIATRDYLSTVG